MSGISPITLTDANFLNSLFLAKKRTRRWKVRLLWVTAGFVFVSILAGSALS